MARDKSEIVNYEETKDRLVITGDFIPVFGDPSLQQTVFLAQIGDSFPLVGISDHTKMASVRYAINIPSRQDNGQLTFRKGYLRTNEDFHRGFLPYTQKNIAYQAFKMLHQPYGWGEMFGARDCSRFMMDLFSTFGILISRDSKPQARVGISLGQLEGKTTKEKQKILDRAIPLATILRLPGHIMLFLSRKNGKYYVIHNIWGIQKAGWFGPSDKKIGRTVASDLSLGKSGPNGSLLDRLTDIQFIGSDLELPKKIP